MDDYRLQLSGTQINNVLNALIGVGAYWMTADANFNPNTAFGGSWVLVGSKLTVDNRVYDNGKSVGMTDGTYEAAILDSGSGVIFQRDAFGLNVGSSIALGYGLSARISTGVLTKAQIQAKGTGYEDATGLITDSVTCYIWQRTA